MPSLVKSANSNHSINSSQQHQHHQHRVFHGLMHSSDWLPTLLSYAQVSSAELPDGLDGFDFSDTLRAVGHQSVLSSHNHSRQQTQPDDDDASAVIYSAQNSTVSAPNSPRSEILLEMYYETDFVFGEQLQAYRLGDWKYINGVCVLFM